MNVLHVLRTGGAAQERVRRLFDTEACSRRLVEIYEELLA